MPADKFRQLVDAEDRSHWMWRYVFGPMLFVFCVLMCAWLVSIPARALFDTWKGLVC